MSTPKKWDYVTAADPCKDCKKLWAEGPYSDEQVKKLFPDASILVPDLMMHPHIHNNCRCKLVNREGIAEIEEEGFDNWLAVLCIALALRKKKAKPKEDEAGSPNFGFGGDTRESFKVITRSDGAPGFFLQDNQGNYRAGPNCTGDSLRAAALDHAEGELGGFMRSFRGLLAVVKDQAQPKPKKKIPPLSGQDAYDIVSLVEAMTVRIRKLIDTVESEEEFEALIKAARLGSVAGLTEAEQEILAKQAQPYQSYWERHVYMLPSEVKTMPPVETENPWEEMGLPYKKLPYTWEKPMKDTAVDTLLRIAKKRLDEAEKRRYAHG